MKNMEHEFLHFKTRTNNSKWKAKSGLPLTIIGWCDQLLTTVKPSLICNYPHYPSVLSRKLESDPTTLIEIAVKTTSKCSLYFDVLATNQWQKMILCLQMARMNLCLRNENVEFGWKILHRPLLNC